MGSVLEIVVNRTGLSSWATIRIETLMVTTAIQMDFDSNSVVSRRDSNLVVSRKDSNFVVTHKDSSPAVSRKDPSFMVAVIVIEMDSTIAMVVALEKDVTSVAIVMNPRAVKVTVVETS